MISRNAQMNTMKILKMILIILIFGSFLVNTLSCGSEPREEEVIENQVITVQRGNLTIDITATGNLALPLKKDLAFEISGTTQEPLTVEEVVPKIAIMYTK